MRMDDLRAKRCVPCRRGTPKLDAAEVARLAPQVPAWSVAGDRLRRKFVFATFADAMRFVNRIADVAEAEDHHPDFTVHYREVDVALWTHVVGGLSENDFIVAAKIDGLVADGGSVSGD
jgi:4a-hydroxytetrahydrobiopterin dehydratase